MSSNQILAIQIGGFVVALVGCFFSHPHWYFLAGFGIHVLGDYLRLRKDGIA